MRFVERNQFISAAAILVCPNGITNISGSSGILTYPSSGDYGVNETKCWKIEVPETYLQIYFTYSRYDIEICESCECDSLRISSSYGVGLRYGGACGRFSDGHLEYRRLLGDPKDDDSSSSTTAYIRFASDETVHHKGFNLTFIAQSLNAGGITAYLNATEDETIEFGTPKVGIKNYPKHYQQQWFLIVPEGRQVQIDFDIFELEESENCKNDYIEFREATIDRLGDLGGTTGPILTRLLCRTKPSTIQSAGNMVLVHFFSNNNATTVYRGFRASFKAGYGRVSASNLLSLLFFSVCL